MSETTPATAPSKRRFAVAVSLRVLMAIVLVVGGTLGWLAREARVQKNAVVAIRKTGGNVYYNWDTGPDAYLIRGPKPGPPAPGWLVKAVGVDFFGHPAMADVGPKGTDADMAQVGLLKGLVNFSIRSRAVTDAGMAEIEGLSRLERLVVPREGAITGASMKSIGRMTALKYLFFGKPVTNSEFSAISGLTRLEVLLMQRSPSPGLTDAGLAKLSQLKHLNVLILNAPAVTSRGLSAIRGMSNLSTLDLEGSRISGLESLRPLTGLTSVRLARTEVGDEGLAVLASAHKLTSLELSDTRITDAGIGHLRDHPSLSSLHLNGTRITGSGLESLSKVETLVNLGLSRSAVTDAGLRHLSGLGQLLRLWLRDTEVGDEGLAAIEGLDKLVMLDLSRTKITDAGLAHLAKMPLGQNLDLSGTAVTDAGVARFLGKKTGLRVVDLRGTLVGKEGLAALSVSGVQVLSGPLPQPAKPMDGPR